MNAPPNARNQASVKHIGCCRVLHQNGTSPYAAAFASFLDIASDTCTIFEPRPGLLRVFGIIGRKCDTRMGVTINKAWNCDSNRFGNRRSPPDLFNEFRQLVDVPAVFVESGGLRSQNGPDASMQTALNASSTPQRPQISPLTLGFSHSDYLFFVNIS